MASQSRSRLRHQGITVGTLPTGPNNAITDVAGPLGGVRVGHVTRSEGTGRLQPGKGPIRTGVTVILPHAGNLFQQKVSGAVHTINGYGKACGFEEVRELGRIESPIGLTNTLNVWRVADALADDAIGLNANIGIDTGSFNALVAECNDGYLNDLQGRHVTAADVAAALSAARHSGDGACVPEGCVGAGTGTSCFGWKGGIGTASRMVQHRDDAWCLGALVQSNFGRADQLIVAGDNVGRRLRPPATGSSPKPEEQSEKGSIVMVLATDAPLNSRQLHRICVRAAAGLARTGSIHGHGSGDFVIAFSVANALPHTPERSVEQRPHLIDEASAIDRLFAATVEAVEESILSSMYMAQTTAGRDNHVRHRFPFESLL